MKLRQTSGVKRSGTVEKPKLTRLRPHHCNSVPTRIDTWAVLDKHFSRAQTPRMLLRPATSHSLNVTLPFLIFLKLYATVGTTSSLHYRSNMGYSVAAVRR